MTGTLLVGVIVGGPTRKRRGETKNEKNLQKGRETADVCLGF